MTSKKFFYVMIGITVLMSGLVVGAVFLGDSFLRKQSEKLVSLKLDNEVIEQQQVALTQAKKDVEKYTELEAISKQIVPQDKDQARAAREIVSLAEQSGISISSITFPSSTLGLRPTTTTPATGTATTPTQAPANPLTQAKPVTGIDGLYQLDITVVSDTGRPATYTRLIEFLERLEQNRRTAQVTQISIQPDSENRINLNFTLTLTVYIKP